MMQNGQHRKRRQLSPEEKWEIFSEVTSQEILQADAARKYGFQAGAGSRGVRSTSSVVTDQVCFKRAASAWSLRPGSEPSEALSASRSWKLNDAARCHRRPATEKNATSSRFGNAAMSGMCRAS